MKRLNSKEVISKLQDSNTILAHGYQGGWLLDKDEGNELGDLSEKVYQNLIDKDKIKSIGKGSGVCDHLEYYDLKVN